MLTCKNKTESVPLTFAKRCQQIFKCGIKMRHHFNQHVNSKVGIYNLCHQHRDSLVKAMRSSNQMAFWSESNVQEDGLDPIRTMQWNDVRLYQSACTPCITVVPGSCLPRSSLPMSASWWLCYLSEMEGKGFQLYPPIKFDASILQIWVQTTYGCTKTTFFSVYW